MVYYYTFNFIILFYIVYRSISSITHNFSLTLWHLNMSNIAFNICVNLIFIVEKEPPHYFAMYLPFLIEHKAINISYKNKVDDKCFMINVSRLFTEYIRYQFYFFWFNNNFKMFSCCCSQNLKISQHQLNVSIYDLNPERALMFHVRFLYTYVHRLFSQDNKLSVVYKTSRQVYLILLEVLLGHFGHFIF